MAADELADDERNLETLLAKATNPLHKHPDPESLAAFCAMVEKEADGPQTALCLLGHKIQSPLEKESLLALCVLEESVKRCGSKFRSEVGKFRFLNEMVKVVSPKYLGNRSSPKVKQKIVELLFMWSVQLTQEVKIFEAYQMLKRQGVVMDDPVYVIEDYKPPEAPPPRPRNAIFDDEERARQLQMLLQSRKPEDLQAANRLIKTMVREADQRMELLAKRSTELETVHNNAKVLADMLDHYSSRDTSAEEKELMKELYDSCERLRPKLFRLAGEMDEKDEGLNDILKANDELTIVISRYKKVMGLEDGAAGSGSSQSPAKNGASLLDLGSPESVAPPAPPSSDTSLLDDQLLALGLKDLSIDSAAPSNSASASNQKMPGQLADLDHLFRVSESSSPKPISSSFQKPLQAAANSAVSGLSSSLPLDAMDSSFSNAKSLTPSLMDIAAMRAQTTPIFNNSGSQSKASTNAALNSSKGLADLEELSLSMLKKSLPATPAMKMEFTNTSQKIPISQLKQQKEQEQAASQQLAQTKAQQSVIPTPVANEFSVAAIAGVTENSSRPQTPDVLSLAEVFVPLETIQPGSLPSLTLFEKNGITVVIHFGKNVPRPDVSVMVASTMSKNSSPVKNVTFQAAVPKSMKIKLQPPSATDLPAHNPILPPAAITQVLLLANPQKEKVRFKYKLNYNLNNEDHTEIGEVDSLFSPR